MKTRLAAPQMLGIAGTAVALLMFSCIFVEGDDIYTWTDNNGTVHISQTPHKGARKLKTREENRDEQEAVQDDKRAILFLGGINDTKYFLDRESVQTFANDRNKYRFNLYVDDKMYTCTAWAYPSGVVGLKPQIGLPDLVQRALRIALLGK